MTIGDLLELLQEKLKTGEFQSGDSIEVVGQQQGYFELYPIQDIVKAGAYTIQIEIEGFIGETPTGNEEEDDANIDELNAELASAEELIEDLRETIEEAVEYLDSNKLNTIGSGSELHRGFKEILWRPVK